MDPLIILVLILRWLNMAHSMAELPPPLPLLNLDKSPHLVNIHLLPHRHPPTMPTHLHQLKQDLHLPRLPMLILLHLFLEITQTAIVVMATLLLNNKAEPTLLPTIRTAATLLHLLHLPTINSNNILSPVVDILPHLLHLPIISQVILLQQDILHHLLLLQAILLLHHLHPTT